MLTLVATIIKVILPYPGCPSKTDVFNLFALSYLSFNNNNNNNNNNKNEIFEMSSKRCNLAATHQNHVASFRRATIVRATA